MKVSRKVVTPAFIPVTLTFETLAELEEFVDFIGGHSLGDEGITVNAFEELVEALNATTAF